MATPINQDAVQKLYVAFFNRPADPAGLAYWESQLPSNTAATHAQIAAVADSFNSSLEYQNLYRNQSNTNIVDSLYQNLFGRQASTTENAYWTNLLNQKLQTFASIALDIAGGAQNSDLTAINLKVAAADAFTTALSSSSKPEAYSGDTAAMYARHWLAVVNDAATEAAQTTPTALNKAVYDATGGGNPNPAPATFTLAETSTAGTGATSAVYGPVMWGYDPHNTSGNTGAQTDTNHGTAADGGIPVTDLVSFLTTITGLDFKMLGLIDANGIQSLANVTSLTISNALSSGAATSGTTTGGLGGGSTAGASSGGSTLSIGYADGSVFNAEVALGKDYFTFLNNLLFDSNGNSRLYQPVVTPASSGSSGHLQAITLTPSINNGGTLETGLTTAGDDTIVAGRLELLQGAYIDGGAGYNILEVDAKGTYAQPAQLLNIQEVRVTDLPNFYTKGDSQSLPAGTHLGGYLNNTILLDGSNLPDPIGAGSDDSWLDLSSATAIKKLVVTDEGAGSSSGAYDYSGNLTIVGVRNAATLRLEGAFTSGATTIQYGQGQTGTLNIQLALGDVTTPINILQNAAVLNIDSQGVVNHMHDFFAGGSVSRMIVTGTGEFAVDQNIAPSFNPNSNVIIDATANTGGLNINFDAGSSSADRFASVTVKGTSNNDEIFVTGVQAYTGDQTASNNGATTLPNGKVTIDAGNGDNVVVTDHSSLVKVTTGSGDDTIFSKGGQVVTIVAGDGSNVINTDGSKIVTITSGAGVDNISAQNADGVTILAGAGDNMINTDNSAVVSITSGAGNDNISSIGSSAVTIDAGAGNNVILASAADSVNITTGSGNDNITAKGQTITINSGGGNDVITVSGTLTNTTDNLHTDHVSGIADANGALLTINTGTGTTDKSTIYFGNDQAGLPAWSQNLPGVTALDGSSIKGANVTLYVDSPTNLTQADLSGLTGTTKVVLENTDYLRITANQFKALGAAAFSTHLSGAAGQVGDIYILLTAGQAFDLSTVADLTSLSPNVKLHFELQEGANLTLTAKEVHNYLADNAITSVTGTNGVASTSPNGIVTVTNAGATFDVANDGDPSRIFGTILENAPGGAQQIDNLIITRGAGPDFFSRPADAVTTDTYVIDSTGAATLVSGSVTTTATKLSIVGNQNVDFTGQKVLVGAARDTTSPASIIATSVNDATIDFSKLVGSVIGLTIKEFDDVKSITGNDTATNHTRVNVELNGNVGSTGNTNGLNSSGVSKYVVTAVNDTANNDGDGNAHTATFYLCDNTKDVQVLGLHGNAGNTVTFAQVPWGAVSPTFLLEGDGHVNWNEGVKADGPPNSSNIGAIAIQFDALQGTGAPAVVNINNGGVALGTTSTGGARPLHVEGITLVNAGSLQVNVTDGNAIINNITDTEAAFTSIKFNASGSLQVGGETGEALALSGLPTHLTNIDATGVTGVFTATLNDMAGAFHFLGAAGGNNLTLNGVTVDPGTTIDGGAHGANLTIDGTVTLDNATLTHINGATLTDQSSLTLSFGELNAIGVSHLNMDAINHTATINLVGLDSTPFSIAAFQTGLNVGISVGVLTVAAQPIVTLDPATDLTGVAALNVQEGTVLNLTAKQFQELSGAGAINGFSVNPVTGVHNPSTNYTVNITGLTQADVNYDGTLHGGDASGLNLSGITAAHGSVTLAGDVNLATTTALGSFNTVVLANNQTLGLATTAQADHLHVSGGTNTTLNMLFTSIPAPIDASHYSVSTVKVQNIAVGGTNVEANLVGLSGSTLVEVYNDLGFVTSYNRNVTVDAQTTVPGTYVAFSDIQAGASAREITNFTMNLSGGTEINGDLQLGTNKTINTSVAGATIPQFLKSLTINSTGTAANLLTSQTPNVIDGIIDPTSIGAAVGTKENNLLSVTVNATQKLNIGGIQFASVNDGVAATTYDSAATATVTVNGTADVNLGTLNTSDTDVDFLNVVDAGSGKVSLTLTNTSPGGTNAGSSGDVLSLTSTGTGKIDVTVGASTSATDSVDLSTATITGVSHLKINGNATVTMTQAEFAAVGAANIDPDALNTTTATLNITNLGSTPFDASGVKAGIVVGTVTLASGNITLDSTTNLTGVTQIIVAKGGTLTLSAAQFEQLSGNGSIIGHDSTGAVTTDFTVHITGLTQAQVNNDVNGNGSYTDTGDFVFNLSDVHANNLDVTLASPSITLGTFSTTGTLVAGSEAVLNNAHVILADNQTLGLVNTAQADGRIVSGGANTTLVFKFDNPTTAAIDAHGYGVSTFKVLDVFAQNGNAEYMLANLPSSTTLFVYHDAASLGFVAQTHRVAIVDANVTVPGFVVFNDHQLTKEVVTLDLTLSGGSKINGNLNLADTVKAADLTPAHFQTLTIHSTGVGANEIVGDVTSIGTGVVELGTTSITNNLLAVNVLAATDLKIDGSIVFQSIGTDTHNDPATFTVSGAGNVTVGHFDVSDAVADGISTLTIANNGTGTLNVLGGSAAVIGGSNGFSSLVFTGTGNVVLGNNPDVTTEWGISAANLSSIDASGLSGSLNLGEVKDINSTGNFTFTAGTGATKLTLSTDTLDATNGTALVPTSATWSFNFGTAAVGSEFHMTGLTLGNTADLLDVNTSNNLSINLGTNTALYIDANLDLTKLDTVSILGTGAHSIVLAKDAVLTLTAAEANGLHIVAGPGGTGVHAPVVNIIGLGTDPVDLSGIATGIAGHVLLGANDVTLDNATNLGGFTVELHTHDLANTVLSGQTIRFANETQAAHAVVVVGDNGLPNVPGDPAYGTAAAPGVGTGPTEAQLLADGGTNGSNVIWLFNSESGPVNTSGYDSHLGRVWFNQSLINSVGNVENLFTTLPSPILRADFANVTLLNVLLSSNPIDRTMEFSNFITLGNLTYSDIGLTPVEHLHSLDLVLGGQVTLGNVLIDDVIPATGYNPLGAAQFTTLTIDSHLALTGRTAASVALPGGNAHPNYLASEAFVNNNNGVTTTGETAQPTNINTVGNIGVGSANGLDLLNVTLNTYGVSVYGTGLAGDGAKLNVGTITYGYVPTAAVPTQTAHLNVTGANDINVISVNTADVDITGLALNTTGFTGVLTAPGASPAFNLGTGTTSLTIANGGVHAGTITLGSATNAGVAGANLNTLDASGFGGILNLGTLALIDGTNNDSTPLTPANDGLLPAFTFTSGTGVETLTLGPDNGLHPELASHSEWDFNLSAAAAGSVMHIAAGTVFDQYSTLNVNLGANGQLVIDSNLSLANLVDDPLTAVTEGLVVIGGSIDVEAGITLTLTVAQEQALTTDIIGAGTVKIVGDASNKSLGAHLKTVGVDVSAVTLIASPASGFDTDATVALTLGDANTGTVAVPVAAAHVVTGSANKDAITVSGTANHIITGGALNDIITAAGGGGSNTYKVDSGSDTIVGMEGDTGSGVGTIHDVLNVSSGATATAVLNAGVSFVATAATTNAGTAIITAAAAGGATIDMHLAGGANGFTITGGTSNTTNDTLIGSSNADIINGGNDNQTTGVDTLTGNGGNDTFQFNVITSTPITLHDSTTTPNTDREVINITAGATASGTMTIAYTLDGVAAAAPLSVALAAGDSASMVASKVAIAFNALSGYSATPVAGALSIEGPHGSGLTLGAITTYGDATLAATEINGLDVSQVERVDIGTLAGVTNHVTVGEHYGVQITLAGSLSSVLANTIAGSTSEHQLAVDMAASINGLAIGVNAAAAVNGAGVWGVNITDTNPDNGGLSVVTSSLGTFNGSGASLPHPNVSILSSDVITDFTSGSDHIQLGIAAGTATNYVEAAETANYATAYGAAGVAMAGGVVHYYLTSVAAAGPDAAYGVLFFDANADGTVDGAIKLVGVDSTHFAATDIIA